MTRHLDFDRALEEWLMDGPSQLPDRLVDAIVNQLDHTKQRRPSWLPGRYEMNRTLLALGGIAAAVVLVAVAGAMFVGLNANRPGLGGQPTPTASPRPSPTSAVSPTVEPTVPTSPTATPQSDPEGVLAPGTYAAHPLPAPNDSLTLTFTVPEGWAGMAGRPGHLDVLVPAGEPDVGPPGGMAILFLDVTTLNGDPCDWSGAEDDVSVGPAVDDLVEAILAQPGGVETRYNVSDPVDVTIGGYSGKRVDIVVPTMPFEGQTSDARNCDEGHFQLWNTTATGEDVIYAQGPADRWHTSILDVDGTRLVIVTRDFEATSSADRAEMDAIIDSLVISP